MEYAPRWWDAEHVLPRMNALVAAAVAEPRADEFLAVAEVDGAPCGFIYTVTREDSLMEDDYAFVLEIVVDQDGRGIGRALLEAAEAWAAAAGLARVSLAVFAANPARGFYEHLGYETGAFLMNKTVRELPPG